MKPKILLLFFIPSPSYLLTDNIRRTENTLPLRNPSQKVSYSLQKDG